jgi:hypothetical protein
VAVETFIGNDAHLIRTARRLGWNDLMVLLDTRSHSTNPDTQTAHFVRATGDQLHRRRPRYVENEAPTIEARTRRSCFNIRTIAVDGSTV